MVRGKFKVVAVTEYEFGNKSVELNAVYSNNAEDNTYAKATPTGTIKMTISNPDAAEQLAVGKSFFVDFTPVE